MTSTPHPRSLLELRDIDKTFRRGGEVVYALRAVSLELRAGEVAALVGPSGSGKSTLLHVVAAWERPDRGEVIRPGAAPGRARAPGWREVALVPQTLGLLEELSLRDNVCWPVRLLGRDRRQRAGVEAASRRAGLLLTDLGLDHVADRSPTEVSLGEQQRAAVARALVLQPRLFLGDEPTGHQDEAWTRRVLQVIRAAAAHSVGCLIATHNPEVIQASDRVLTMRDGRVVAASPDATFDEPLRTRS
jgi:ABC-type lipoprotein export system ATPase subunit